MALNLDKIFPHLSEDVKLAALSECGGDERAAANYLLNDACRALFRDSVNHFLPTFTNCNSNTPKLPLRSFVNPVENGDCVFACLMFCIRCMAGAPVTYEVTDEEANGLRQLVRAFILLNWDEQSDILNGMWGSIIAAEYSDLDSVTWGKEEWLEHIDAFGHVGIVEMSAFLEMAEMNGISLSIRIWARRNYQIVRSAMIPDMLSSPRCIVDLILTGPANSDKSHYKVFKSGSFFAASLPTSSSSSSGKIRKKNKLRRPDLIEKQMRA